MIDHRAAVKSNIKILSGVSRFASEPDCQCIDTFDCPVTLAKRLDSPYLIGKRSSDWLKIKVAHTADFEVIGCVPMRGEKAVRALLLSERVQGRLMYKGKVGSGLTRRQRQDFLAELANAPKLQKPVDCPSGSICRLSGWRCRVRYFGLTEMGHLRSPTFKGLI
jgi:ATP-dependent DNA ligase